MASRNQEQNQAENELAQSVENQSEQAFFSEEELLLSKETQDEEGADMLAKVWREKEIIQGYREMAEINLACADEFFPLEEEVERARSQEK